MRLFEGTPWDQPVRCDRCGRLEQQCQCTPESTPAAQVPAEKQTAQLRLEKRKKGKIVTLVAGLHDQGNHLPDLLTALKSMCGAGGTLREGVIEIQGDHLERVRQRLKERGYRVK